MLAASNGLTVIEDVLGELSLGNPWMIPQRNGGKAA